MFKAHGSGNLAKDVILRQTKSGKAVAEMTLIANRRKTKNNQDPGKDAMICVLWGRQAEIAHEYLKKGMRPHVEGVYRQDRYTDNNGNKRVVTRLYVTDLELPPKPKTAGEAPVVEAHDTATEIDTDEIPF